MNLIEILKNPVINTGAIATTLYHNKPAQNARALFRNKLYNINSNRFNPNEIDEIKKILENICIRFE